jgi:hypothetical protein
MRKQTLIWTTLPAGAQAPADPADGTLRLSVHVAPRLRTDEGLPVPTLSQFPELLDWPGTVRSMGWTVLLDGQKVPATLVSDPRRDLWNALFDATTFVRPFVFPDLPRRKVRSYPVRNVSQYLIDLYRTTAVSSPTGFPAYNRLIQPDALGALTFDREQNSRPVEDEIEVILAREQAVPPGPPDPPRDFFQVRRFHQPRGQRLIDVQVPDFDFHQVVALVLDHPALLRLLGLVVDLSIPAKALAGLPPEVTVSVVPTRNAALRGAVGSGLTSIDVTPDTRCLVGADTLAAAPRADGPDLVDGYLPVGDAERFAVTQIDPDGGALKALELAANLQRSRRHVWDEQPQDYALATLRSAGFSLARVGRAPALVAGMKRAQAHHDAVEAGQPVVFDAEDLTRGYRVDVWDSASRRWHSLQARRGRYTFVGTGIELSLDDEGVLTTTPTSAADDSSPDLYLQESLFQWMGWSMGAPPFGTAIGPDHSVNPDPESKAATKYPLEVRFRPEPGSLPRLRFGLAYRFRMRGVDLGGGSRPPSPADDRADPATATAEVRYGRFEPVSSPALAWRQPATEGEALDQLVIRSNYDTAAEADSQRHVVPPQAAQLLAEHHGMFDTPAAPGQPSVIAAAAWGQIGERERQTLSSSPDVRFDTSGPRPEPYFEVERLDLPYLPDPIARGATFAFPEPLSLTKTSFAPEAGRPWYEQRPVRLVLAEGPQSATYDEAKRVLTLTLPKAAVLKIRLSTYVDGPDLASLGVWHLIEEAKLPETERATLQRLATDGRHWMLTPFRELTFVHAVRQPLATPELGAFAPLRAAGQTFVTYHSTISFDRKSTERVDVLARWSEPVDGGLGAPDPSTRQVSVTAFNVPFTNRPTDPPQQLQVVGQHELGDTKHRQITYTAVATSRFTRYFVARRQLTLHGTGAVTLDPAGLVPGSVEVSDPDGEYAEERDFTVDPAAGTIRRATASHLADGAAVQVQYLAQPVTRSTEAPAVRDVPSAARPAAPAALYAVPTFAWGTQRTSAQIVSARKGGGLRVYLERPWWSSGEGELLGVVVERNAGATKPAAVRDRMRALVTQWGVDPLFQTAAAPPASPSTGAFPLAVKVGTDLSLHGAPETVDVAGHAVAFDAERKLWYCDIDANLSQSYFPHLRLALVRYQPSSIQDAHLSRVVLLDFIQVAPDRTVTVVKSPATPTKATVSVTGPSYLAPGHTTSPEIVTVRSEVRDPAVPGDLGWVPPPLPDMVTLSLIPGSSTPLWRGEITFSSAPQPGTRRLVVEEYEAMPPPASGLTSGSTRVVFTDTIEL